MKSTIKLLGLIALVVITGFLMPGCDNGTTGGDSGDGNIVTFYLHKVSSDVFYLVVEGAKWNDTLPTGFIISSESDPLEATYIAGGTYEATVNMAFDLPTKIFSDTWQFQRKDTIKSLSGRIELPSDQSVLYQFGLTNTDGGMYLPAGDKDYTRHWKNYFLEY